MKFNVAYWRVMMIYLLTDTLVDCSVNKTALTNPGPGAYGTPEKNIRYKNSPSWGLGSAKRSDLSDS